MSWGSSTCLLAAFIAPSTSLKLPSYTLSSRSHPPPKPKCLRPNSFKAYFSFHSSPRGVDLPLSLNKCLRQAALAQTTGTIPSLAVPTAHFFTLASHSITNPVPSGLDLLIEFRLHAINYFLKPCSFFPRPRSVLLFPHSIWGRFVDCPFFVTNSLPGLKVGWLDFIPSARAFVCSLWYTLVCINLPATPRGSSPAQCILVLYFLKRRLILF